MLSLFFAAFLLQATYIDLYNEGHKLLDAGKFKEAELVLKDAASSNPKHTAALYDLAKVYVKLKRFPEAIELYRQIIEINPKDINSRSHLAELYSWVGNYDKSIVTYKDALELDPANPDLKLGLAKVLRWSHRHDEAERLYKEVLQIDPEHHEALKGFAKTYSMTGNLKGAVEILNKVIKLYPNDAELHKEMGTVLAWQKHYKDAIISLKKSIELSPDYTDAYRTMGDVYLWMNLHQQAIDSYKKAADIEPDNIENYLLLTRLYKQIGDKRLAEESIKKALRIAPADTQAVDLLHEVRGMDEYRFKEKAGDIIETAAFIFVLVVVFFSYKRRRRMLIRRHRLYLYFLNLMLPMLILIILALFFGKGSLSEWLDGAVIEDITEALLFFAMGISFLTLLWTEHRSHEFMKMIILAVGAHPDDIELGCSGFIMKAKDGGAKVYALTMSRGEKGAGKNGKREEELKRAVEFMGLDDFWVLDFPDTGLKDSVAMMKDAIEEKIKETGATMVLTHTAIDIHTDHQAVFEASKVAARNISMLCYEDVGTPREFVPNYLVDITNYIEDKMKIVTFHKTQEDKTYMDPELIKGRAAHRGIQGGIQYAEAYRIHNLLR
ncbi:MAG: tetratricopeptide repeat protein [Deltaproteobacteria bacterium]|nr:tetratricopeptide repeat protein [Deltaproteobacteria bacterium]